MPRPKTRAELKEAYDESVKYIMGFITHEDPSLAQYAEHLGGIDILDHNPRFGDPVPYTTPEGDTVHFSASARLNTIKIRLPTYIGRLRRAANFDNRPSFWVTDDTLDYRRITREIQALRDLGVAQSLFGSGSYR